MQTRQMITTCQKIAKEKADLELLKSYHEVGNFEKIREYFELHGFNMDVIDLPFGQFCQQINMIKHDLNQYQREHFLKW